MNRILFFILCVLMTDTLYSQAKALICPLGPEWKLDEQFSDEFHGKKLDDQKWWDFNPAWVGRKPSYFDRENVKLKKGALVLTAKKLDPAKVSVENKARGYDQFSTAIVKSKQRSYYGYYEARCKSMSAAICNAFWLYDPLDFPTKYREGEHSEEIDIFEVFGKANKKENQRTYFSTIHRYQTPYVESLVNAKKYTLPNRFAQVKVDYDFYADYHVFGLLWTPQELVWYLDGKEVFRRENDFFKRPLYITLDAEIMNDWDGLPNADDLPSNFSIDYVRVWRKEF